MRLERGLEIDTNPRATVSFRPVGGFLNVKVSFPCDSAAAMASRLPCRSFTEIPAASAFLVPANERPFRSDITSFASFKPPRGDGTERLIPGLEVLELLSVALANPADDHRTGAGAPEGGVGAR